MDEPSRRKELPPVVTRTRNPVQRVFHALLAVAGWILFVWFWVTVFLRGFGREAVTTIAILVVALVGIVAVHLLWVTFNVNLHRARGPRSRIREVTFAGTTDQLGRPLLGADWDRLRLARRILVEIDDKTETKVYRAVSPIGSGEVRVV